MFEEPVIQWHQANAEVAGAPKGDQHNTWCLVVVNRGGVFQYDWDAPYPDPFPTPWAWGSNYELALGLMLAGKTAEEAVRIMCERSTGCGGEVQVVNIAEALGLQKVQAEFARNPHCDRPECQTTLGCQCRMEAAE